MLTVKKWLKLGLGRFLCFLNKCFKTRKPGCLAVLNLFVLYPSLSRSKERPKKRFITGIAEFHCRLFVKQNESEKKKDKNRWRLKKMLLFFGKLCPSYVINYKKIKKIMNTIYIITSDRIPQGKNRILVHSVGFIQSYHNLITRTPKVMIKR